MKVLGAVVKVPGVVVLVFCAEGHTIVAAPFVGHGVPGVTMVTVDVQTIVVRLVRDAEVVILRPALLPLKGLQLHTEAVIS